MFKKWSFVMVALTLVVAVFLSACGNNKGGAASQSPSPSSSQTPVNSDNNNADNDNKGSDEKIKLTLSDWSSGEPEKIIKNAISEFEKLHPNITVERIQIPFANYPDKIQTMMAGKTTPDVMYMSQLWFPTFAEKGAFLDLKPYTDKDAEFNYGDFLPIIQKTGEVNGGIYEIFDALDYIVLFYNKDMFKAAGVDFPSDNWTWDDLVAAGKKLTKDTNNDGTIDQYGFIAPDGYVSFSWIYQNGGLVLNDDLTQSVINQPAAVEALQWIQDLMLVHKIAPGPSVTAQQGTSAMFKAGNVAMAAYGHWLNPGLDADNKFEYGVAMLPKGKVNRNSFVSGAGYAVSKDSKHQDAAWELLKWLTRPDIMIESTKLNSAVASRKSVYESELFMSNPNNAAFIEQTKYMQPLPVTTKWNEMFDVVKSEYQLIWSGKQTAQQGADAITEKVNKILK